MAEQAFHDSDDPADLPLFTQVLSTRPGRVRSTFSMRNNPVASREDLTEAVSPPDTFRVTKAPQGWGQPRAGRRLRIGMDWSLVARLRAQASERLSASLGEEPGHLNREAQQELGRSIILDLLQTEAQQHLSAGNGSWSMAEQDAVAKAVFDALFGLGRLQPLVDDDRIENIIITGHDTVRLELTDGTIIPGEPVADSDSGAHRVPGVPGQPVGGERPAVQPGPAAAASAVGRRGPAGRGGLGDLAAVGGDPPAPAAPGQPG